MCKHWCAVGTPTLFIVSGLYSGNQFLSLHPSTSPARPLCNPKNKKLPNCQTLRWVPLGWSQWRATRHQHCDFECAKWHDIIHQKSARTNACKTTAILSDCVMNGSSCRPSCSWRPLPDWISCYNHFNSPQSIGELGSVMDSDWFKNYASLVKEWRDIKFDVLIWWSPISQIELHNLWWFINRIMELYNWIMESYYRPVSQIRAPSGGLSRTSGKLWQDYSNCYMFWT